MQFFIFLTLLTTVECIFWKSAFLAKSGGLKAQTGGFLRHQDPEEFEESVKSNTPSLMHEELLLQTEPCGHEALLLEAEASTGLDALQLQPENTTTTTTECSVELYQHGDFAGWQVRFPVGEYNHKEMIDKGALNDDASAVKVIGTGCCAEVYEHGDFSGWSVEFPEGEYHHRDMAHRGVPNDKVSSVKVFLCADKKVAIPDVEVEKETMSAEEQARVAKIKSERSLEGTLIESLRHSGPGGEEALECVKTCRFGETRLEWRECIDWCVEIPFTRSRLLAMLPKAMHKAHAQHVEMPAILKGREHNKKQRSSEL